MISRRGLFGGAFASLLAAITAPFSKAEAQHVDETKPSPGMVRVRVVPEKGTHAAVGWDTRVEVMQEDGTWLALAHVTSADISIRPDRFVAVNLGLLAGSVDISRIVDVSVSSDVPLPPDQELSRAIDRMEEANLRARRLADDSCHKLRAMQDQLSRARIAHEAEERLAENAA
jgi:hypothetical protein